jgi:hypothetical protein
MLNEPDTSDFRGPGDARRRGRAFRNRTFTCEAIAPIATTRDVSLAP